MTLQTSQLTSYCSGKRCLIGSFCCQLFLNCIGAIAIDCQTVPGKGKDPNKKCAFPFIWNGESHNSCIKDINLGNWCSTSVDKDGQHVKGKWGVCSSSCPGNYYLNNFESYIL